MLRDGGVIARGYDADLDELRAIQENCGQFLLDLEARERARSGIANLKVEYNRVHGFYIEVSHANADKVPDDYRRRQTLKNAERYITPELKSFEDKALSAQERALAREKQLYDDLLARLCALDRAAADHRPRRGAARRLVRAWPTSACATITAARNSPTTRPSTSMPAAMPWWSVKWTPSSPTIRACPRRGACC